MLGPNGICFGSSHFGSANPNLDSSSQFMNEIEVNLPLLVSSHSSSSTLLHPPPPSSKIGAISLAPILPNVSIESMKENWISIYHKIDIVKSRKERLNMNPFLHPSISIAESKLNQTRKNACHSGQDEKCTIRGYW